MTILTEVKVSSVIDGVCLAITNAFEDAYPVYTDFVEQGFSPGSFYVKMGSFSDDLFRWNRFRRRHTMLIQYVSDETTEAVEDCWNVANTLRQVLERIRIGEESVEGYGFSAEMYDGVLTVTIEYDCFVDKQEENDPEMNSVETGVKANGE